MNRSRGFETDEDRKARFARLHPHLSPEHAAMVELHGPEACQLAEAVKKYDKL